MHLDTADVLAFLTILITVGIVGWDVRPRRRRRRSRHTPKE